MYLAGTRWGTSVDIAVIGVSANTTAIEGRFFNLDGFGGVDLDLP